MLEDLLKKLSPLIRYMPRNGRYHQQKVLDEYKQKDLTIKEEIEEMFNTWEKGETVVYRDE